jgi:hypothetical protein
MKEVIEMETPAEEPKPENNQQPPAGNYFPPAGYAPQPSYAYGSYPNYYRPRKSNNAVLNIFFWIFYALVGIWIDFSLTFSAWVCAVVLPFTLPMIALKRTGILPDKIMVMGSNEWFYAQSDTLIYMLATLISALGVFLLLFLVRTFKYWVKFHKVMFRDLGGLRI